MPSSSLCWCKDCYYIILPGVLCSSVFSCSLRISCHRRSFIYCEFTPSFFASTTTKYVPLLPDVPSTGLILSPGALEVTSSNRFFRYSSVGYSVTPKGYDSWSIANYWSWNSTKYLNRVWNQGACGEQQACLIMLSMASCQWCIMRSNTRRFSVAKNNVFHVP